MSESDAIDKVESLLGVDPLVGHTFIYTKPTNLQESYSYRIVRIFEGEKKLPPGGKPMPKIRNTIYLTCEITPVGNFGVSGKNDIRLITLARWLKFNKAKSETLSVNTVERYLPKNEYNLFNAPDWWKKKNKFPPDY